jgi:hypothetical protein
MKEPTMSSPDLATTFERQRLLEGWLPLAQDANDQYGWALDGPGLEILILRAAPALQAARTALEARAMLWSTYYRLHHEAEP